MLGCDPSESLLDHARRTIRDERVSFAVGTAEDPPRAAGGFDCVVSGLALNFADEPVGACRLLAERLRPGGLLGAYVWDYGEGMEFLRCFWDEAVALDSAAERLDEARRFPVCQEQALRSTLVDAGLREVTSGELVIATEFHGFEDFWRPFLRGTGPAPSYVASLPGEARDRLRDRLAERVKADPDGTIRLQARAWAVRGSSGPR